MLPRRALLVLAAIAPLTAVTALHAHGLPRHVHWPGGKRGEAVCQADGEARTYRAGGNHFHLRADGQDIRYGDGLLLTAAGGRTFVRLNRRLAVVLEPGETWMVTPGYRPIDLETSAPVTLDLVRLPAVAGLACPEVASP